MGLLGLGSRFRGDGGRFGRGRRRDDALRSLGRAIAPVMGPTRRAAGAAALLAPAAGPPHLDEFRLTRRFGRSGLRRRFRGRGLARRLRGRCLGGRCVGALLDD